ncbi:hypothetical protein ColTof3_00052 [Colletotrichum tofieldiae]|nr:hypothetical protein ColTof3_00052 [Colletotrichum tofieldiae]
MPFNFRVYVLQHLAILASVAMSFSAEWDTDHVKIYAYASIALPFQRSDLGRTECVMGTELINDYYADANDTAIMSVANLPMGPKRKKKVDMDWNSIM